MTREQLVTVLAPAIGEALGTEDFPHVMSDLRVLEDYVTYNEDSDLCSSGSTLENEE